MIINHNMSAAFANRSLGLATSDIQSSMSKLSSGMRINKAGDDASGLAVSEKMRAQIRGLQQASQNAQNGESFIQTAEGYLAETTDVLQRMRVLAVQSANGIYTSEDRDLVQIEMSQLVDEVDRIAKQAQYNGMTLLTGRFSEEAGGTAVQFHIGANVDQNISTSIGDMTAASLGLQAEGEQIAGVSIASPEDANRSLDKVDQALKAVTAQRANLGAVQNRMTYLQQGQDIGAENLQAAESRIRDVDMADEVSKFIKSQILVQSGTAMLAQANTTPQSVLRLLQ